MMALAKSASSGSSHSNIVIYFIFYNVRVKNVLETRVITLSSTSRWWGDHLKKQTEKTKRMMPLSTRYRRRKHTRHSSSR